jgi:hypothetical protein
MPVRCRPRTRPRTRADAHVSGVAELARSPTALTSLTLCKPSIPDDSWPRLLAAPWASRLRRLSLSEEPLGTYNGESGAGLRALARAPLPALVDLETCDASLTPADLSGTLAAAPWLGQITRLKLAVEWLGAPGLGALASLRLPRLRCLSLVYVSTNEAALVALGAAPWLTRLTRLEIEESGDDFGEVMDLGACDYILEGRGFSAGNPFAPLAREGVITHEFG